MIYFPGFFQYEATILPERLSVNVHAIRRVVDHKNQSITIAQKGQYPLRNRFGPTNRPLMSYSGAHVKLGYRLVQDLFWATQWGKRIAMPVKR